MNGADPLGARAAGTVPQGDITNHEDSSCPITTRHDGVAGHGLVGEDPLQALIPNNGVAIADELKAGGYHDPFYWLTETPGRLRIRAQRLDGPGDATIYDPLSVRPGIGLRPTDIVFSEIGCWRIRGRFGSTHLAVVLRVTRSTGDIVTSWQGGGCPVTTPSDHDRGHGTASLRVIIPADGAYAAPADPSGGYILKIPWWREKKGHLTVEVERLDGPGHATVHVSESSYSPTGWLPTGVLVSDLGCWRITGTLDEEDVSAVLRIKDAGNGPAG